MPKAILVPVSVKGGIIRNVRNAVTWTILIIQKLSLVINSVVPIVHENNIQGTRQFN